MKPALPILPGSGQTPLSQRCPTSTALHPSRGQAPVSCLDSGAKNACLSHSRTTSQRQWLGLSHCGSLQGSKKHRPRCCRKALIARRSFSPVKVTESLKAMVYFKRRNKVKKKKLGLWIIWINFKYAEITSKGGHFRTWAKRVTNVCQVKTWQQHLSPSPHCPICHLEQMKKIQHHKSYVFKFTLLGNSGLTCKTLQPVGLGKSM